MSKRIEGQIKCLVCGKWFTEVSNMPYVNQDYCSAECEENEE